MFDRKKNKDVNHSKVKELLFGKTKASPDKIVQKIPALTMLTCSAIGNRKYQQDALYVSAKGRLLTANQKTRILAVVCDGIGRMSDGEKASNTAIQMISQEFRKVEKIPELDIPLFLRKEIYAIDRTIASFPKKNEKSSGTTIVACIAEDNHLYWYQLETAGFISSGEQKSNK